MDYFISNKIVPNKAAFLKKVGFVHVNNLNQILEGKQGFTNEQIRNIGKVYKVNMNWIYGFEEEMWREDKKLSTIQILKQAVMAVESSLKNPKKTSLTKHLNKRRVKATNRAK